MTVFIGIYTEEKKVKQYALGIYSLEEIVFLIS